MLYADVWVSFTKFVAILLDFYCIKMFRKITFKRIVMNVLITVIFQYICLFPDASLLVVVAKSGWMALSSAERK